MTGAAAALVTGAALLAFVLALARTRSLRVALPVLLDLLLAAGLLRLTGDPSPAVLATAAALVVVRQGAGRALRSAAG